MYSTLSQAVVSEATGIKLENADELKEKFVATFLKNTAGLKEDKEDDLANVALSFDSKKKKKRKVKRLDLRSHKRKTLSSRERRDLKIFDITKQEQKYSLYTPLHNLWCGYIAEVIDFSKVSSKNLHEVEMKLLKADYHGAILTVTKARCPSLVGCTGIVLQESKNTFKMITKENKLKTIPKKHTVFTFSLQGHIITVYGSNFCFKPADRSTRNFKIQPTIDVT